jgi:4a-hydroxytetrahydrobiopterin dehydratase
MSPHRERKVLNAVQIEDALTELEGWEYKGGRIERVFKTGTFMDGLEFVQKIAEEAEAMGHHPDVTLTFPKTKIQLITHDVNGISDLDTKLAAKVNSIAISLGVS